MSDKRTNYERFISGYSGKDLLRTHSLTETGVWQVRGEDPNCDWSGSHHMPDLGTFEGALHDVIEYAVELPRFWAWGGGGDIKKVSSPIKVNPETNRARARLAAEKARLEAELVRVNNAMEQL